MREKYSQRELELVQSTPSHHIVERNVVAQKSTEGSGATYGLYFFFNLNF